MGTPYIGEIRMFAGNFAPAGWELCEGQLLSISENEALFTLIGTTYGGDGQSTFALPDLRGRLPVHQGSGPGVSNRVIGETGGTETVTLTTSQIPAHSHVPQAVTTTGQADPTNRIWAASPNSAPVYAVGPVSPDAPMSNGLVGTVGGSQPHENMQPYLCVSFIISLYGIYPSQS